MLNTFKNIRKLPTVLATTVALAISAASSSALAASTNAVGGLNQIEYPGGMLMIQYAGVNYRASLSSPCGAVAAQNWDVIKAWTSLAQASLLSGKTLIIYHETCGTTKYITNLVLVR